MKNAFSSNLSNKELENWSAHRDCGKMLQIININAGLREVIPKASRTTPVQTNQALNHPLHFSIMMSPLNPKPWTETT
jgi:hypothetical protein